MKTSITSNLRSLLRGCAAFLNTYRLSTLATLLFAPALTGAATVIDHVPYIISAAGEYELQNNLTANGTTGIHVQAANVVINLNGFTLAQSGGSTNFSDGIEVTADNVIVRNGTVSGFTGGVSLKRTQGKAEDVRLLGNTVAGVLVEGDKNTVVNCFIVGTGTAGNSSGIVITGNSNLVKNNQVSDSGGSGAAIQSFPIGNAPYGSAFIQNYVANSATGLSLTDHDYYQGIVTTNSQLTTIQGGHAIGTENGGD